MDKTNFFAPIALILGWMKRGEFEFGEFTIPDLATAIEITDVLHIDRFGRLKQASDDIKNAFLDRLADYFEASNVLKSVPEELRFLADSGNWQAVQEKTSELIVTQFAKEPLPSGSGSIGWMYESLPLVRKMAKEATIIAETPADRRERIRSTVDEMKAHGKTKTKAFEEVAKMESVTVHRIKQIYYEK